VSVSIERCNTPNDVLHDLVRDGFAELQATLSGSDRALPRFVERELERFLTCGDPREGFAWLSCADCDHHRLVPFTCKGRGFCPSCGGRRMADRAARWVDTLLPRVAVRQYVVTVPWPRRWILARRPDLARGVLAIALREIQRWLRTKGTAQLAGEAGSITVVQRFGSALNLNVHFHCLVLDGLFVEAPNTGAPRWHRARAPTTEDIEALVVRIADRAEAFLARRGHGREEPGDEAERAEDDALALIQSASVAGRSATRRGRTASRVQVKGGRPFQLPPRCATCDGYTVHAGVVIGAKDREGLERLCRYIARPPLAKPRAEILADGRVRIHLKRAWSDGTAAVDLTRMELAERLVALVPPPRANQVHYHGVLASRSRLRKRVRPEPPMARQAPASVGRRLSKMPRGRSRWTPWSTLLWRVFGVEGFACPSCSRTMKLRAVVLPPATLGVLASLERSARGPPERQGGRKTA
jgi:hypothetical protein